MRSITTLLLLALSAFVTVHADNVTEQEAMNVARQFIVNHQTGSRKASLQLHLAKKAMSKSGEVDYYVFSRGADQGFVVVGGDDRALPVWGYSNEGTFNGEDMPENVAWWMEEYQRQLEFLRQHPDAARQPRRLSTSVDPLMTTKWKQGTPYNQEIPSIRFPLGTYKPAVGCVALAMAQMMKAHNWPTTGEGSHSYSWQPEGAQRATTFSADFGNTTYQWASMKDSYSSSQDATAVGTLCYHAGVAVDMMYNTADNGGSGAQIYDAMKALRNYFRYDKGLDLYLRDFYPLDTWEQMLRDDLDQGNPIIYGGSTENMYGHCFVFDGYDADGKFHINWGWGGDYNGWFVSSVLDSGRSGADFSSWQQAILGAKPDRDGTSTGSNLRPLTGYLIDLEATKSQVVVGGSVNLKIEGITFLGEGSYTLNYCGVEIVTDDEQTVVKDEWQADCSAMKVGESYAIDESAAVNMVKMSTAGSLYLLPAIEAGIEKGLFSREFAYHVVSLCCEGAGKAMFGEHYSIQACRDYLGVPNSIGKDGRILGGLIELQLQSVFCPYEVEAFNENEVIYVIDRKGLQLVSAKTLPDCHFWLWKGAVKTLVDAQWMVWEEDSPEGKMRIKIAKKIDKFQ